jgi:nucleotide-binding universal stress UspA family protein
MQGEPAMKSILLYANDNDGLEARLCAALDLARVYSGHITCVQVTPYDAFILGDPFGGVYALPQVVEEISRAEEENKARVEERLRREGVSWTWLDYDGQPAQIIAELSRLTDIIVTSMPPHGKEQSNAPLSLAADVAVHVRSLVMAVPSGCRRVDLTGNAVVAWNGSPEASNALRMALPLLRTASAVNIVTVCEEDGADFPPTEACEYLARHNVASELHECQRHGRAVADSLLEAASGLGGGYVLMGAYGHSRLREAMLGGVTRAMLHKSSLPLVLGH